MAKKSKWDLPKGTESNKKNDAPKSVTGAPANEVSKKSKKELETQLEKGANNNTSNITINNPIVVRYGKTKEDVRTARYNVNVRKTPTDTENNIIDTVKIGEKITVLTIDGDWAKIGENRYVMIRYFD